MTRPSFFTLDILALASLVVAERNEDDPTQLLDQAHNDQAPEAVDIHVDSTYGRPLPISCPQP